MANQLVRTLRRIKTVELPLASQCSKTGLAGRIGESIALSWIYAHLHPMRLARNLAIDRRNGVPAIPDFFVVDKAGDFHVVEAKFQGAHLRESQLKLFRDLEEGRAFLNPEPKNVRLARCIGLRAGERIRATRWVVHVRPEQSPGEVRPKYSRIRVGDLAHHVRIGLQYDPQAKDVTQEIIELELALATSFARTNGPKPNGRHIDDIPNSIVCGIKNYLVVVSALGPLRLPPFERVQQLVDDHTRVLQICWTRSARSAGVEPTTS